MTNRLDIITLNAAGNSWVDNSPGAALTGYQAQNTNIDARTSGNDKSYVYISGTDVKIAISGHVDVDGLPFACESEQTIALPATAIDRAAKYYLRVEAGSDDEYKDVTLNATAPTWNAAKNGYYSGAYRYLHWVISLGEEGYNATRLMPPYAVESYNNAAGSIVDRKTLNYLYFGRIKRIKEISGSGTWDGYDKICVNRTTGQIIVYDNSADTYTVYNPHDHSTFGSTFGRPAAMGASKPDAIFWSITGSCLVSYSDATGYLYYHTGYSSTTTKTVNVGTAYNWSDVVSYKDVAGVEHIIGSTSPGSGSRLNVVSISGSTPTLVQSFDQASVYGRSIYLNTDLDIVILNDDGNNDYEHLSLKYYDGTILYNISAFKYTGYDIRLYRITYNPVTGGAYALQRVVDPSANAYVYLVELGI